MEEQQLLLKIVHSNVMSGFCYTYCKLLFERLKKIDAADRLFIDGRGYDASAVRELRPIAYCILSELAKQISYDYGVASHAIAKETDRLIETVADFLSIFD